MKKISTVTAKKVEKVVSQKLTIGLDLGDRWSWYCVLDETGEVVLEQKVATTPKAMKEVFGGMARSRMALETGTHSPWVSRVLSELGQEVIVAHACNVRLIGESRKKDDRRDARTLARLVRIDPQLLAPVKHRSAQAQADLMAIRARAGLVRTRTVVDQYGARSDEVIRRAITRLQSADHDPGEGAGTESGTASGIGAATGSDRVIESLSERIVEYNERIEQIGRASGR